MFSVQQVSLKIDTTAKPVNSGHHWKRDKVTVLGSLPLFRGSIILKAQNYGILKLKY